MANRITSLFWIIFKCLKTFFFTSWIWIKCCLKFFTSVGIKYIFTCHLGEFILFRVFIHFFTVKNIYINIYNYFTFCIFISIVKYLSFITKFTKELPSKLHTSRIFFFKWISSSLKNAFKIWIINLLKFEDFWKTIFWLLWKIVYASFFHLVYITTNIYNFAVLAEKFWNTFII